VDGTRFAVAGFTNLTQDHLDYHATMDEYFDAKAMLFDPRFTAAAVINADDPYGKRLLERTKGLAVVTYGRSGADITCRRERLGADGTRASIRTPSGTVEIETALVGAYNVDNVMCAAGIALALDLPVDAIVAGARNLARVPGRLERVDAGQPFSVLVDYAHTPDALEHAIRAARDLSAGRVIVVFGCGGDRDRGKRPLMGAVATSTADLTVITSDNPRSEEPLAIVADIEAGCAGGAYRVEVDRREAIGLALAEARAGDVVLIAGKGHETGQTFAGRTVPFDDREVARELLEGVRA
jgi:UDP-N-acetylmuramoyl-L-alanyl-D-glutamate--2,6-diaminopimelate ligase